MGRGGHPRWQITPRFPSGPPLYLYFRLHLYLFHYCICILACIFICSTFVFVFLAAYALLHCSKLTHVPLLYNLQETFLINQNFLVQKTQFKKITQFCIMLCPLSNDHCTRDLYGFGVQWQIDEQTYDCRNISSGYSWMKNHMGLIKCGHRARGTHYKFFSPTFTGVLKPSWWPCLSFLICLSFCLLGNCLFFFSLKCEQWLRWKRQGWDLFNARKGA